MGFWGGSEEVGGDVGFGEDWGLWFPSPPSQKESEPEPGVFWN